MYLKKIIQVSKNIQYNDSPIVNKHPFSDQINPYTRVED